MHKTIPYEAVITDIIKVRGDISSMKENAGIVVTLAAESWSGANAPYTQTVSCSGVTSTNDFIVAPLIETAEDLENHANAQILATAQGLGTITFSAFGYKPETDLKFNIRVLF